LQSLELEMKSAVVSSPPREELTESDNDMIPLTKRKPAADAAGGGGGGVAVEVQMPDRVNAAPRSNKCDVKAAALQLGFGTPGDRCAAVACGCCP
jgi:hypothetical protein